MLQILLVMRSTSTMCGLDVIPEYIPDHRPITGRRNYFNRFQPQLQGSLPDGVHPSDLPGSGMLTIDHHHSTV